MITARFRHTATWVPANKVVIIGGFVSPTAATAAASIEVYDPASDTFQLLTSVLAFPRGGHSATLLPNGKILVAGGFDASGVPFPAEILDPAADAIMTAPGPLVDRQLHTATRLASGWVLLAGGIPVAGGPPIGFAQLFQPELGLMGEFTATMPLMNTPRASHAASLLGDGHALLTGGDSVGPVTASSAELFFPDTLTFTPTIPMLQPRAEHSSTPTDCGAIVVIGGRNAPVSPAATYLDSVEIYPFENMNPVVAGVALFAGSAPGTADLHVGITDPDADGGYLIVRYRLGSSGMFMLATIDQQTPSTAPGGFPNMHVSGLPSSPVDYVFRWNHAADGLASGQAIQLEVLPIGATLGTAVLLNAAVP
jgi:hypothetical protein